VNPPLRFLLDVRVKLIRTIDGAVLYDAWFRYAGNERSFVGWAADSARPICAELDLAYAVLAEKIIDELFFLVLFPAPTSATP
jgi:hypothetical protein